MMLALLFLLIVLQVLDAALTIKVLSDGGREANPVMRWAMNKIGVVGAMAVIKVALVVLVAAVWNESLTFWIDMAYIGVVGWNSYQVIKS